jgi:hypothetical protein
MLFAVIATAAEAAGILWLFCLTAATIYDHPTGPTG